MTDTFDEATIDEASETPEAPAPLPRGVMSPEGDPGTPEGDLPLHLRILRAIVEGEPTQERIDQALLLANEVYELETAALELEE